MAFCLPAEKDESGREDGGGQRESADGDRNSPAGVSRGDDGGGSHSYHSETEAAGASHLVI